MPTSEQDLTDLVKNWTPQDRATIAALVFFATDRPEKFKKQFGTLCFDVTERWNFDVEEWMSENAPNFRSQPSE